jgi:hypothetical protein
MRKLAFVVLLAACGPSSSEIRTAKLAEYNASPREILHVAMEVTRETYKIESLNEERLELVTVPRWFTSEGGTESAGAEGVTMIRPGSIQVTLVVRCVVNDDKHVVVEVTPKTFQSLQGSPQPRELAPDDPNLPPWVLGRADSLQLAIYQRAKPYALAPPQGK